MKMKHLIYSVVGLLAFTSVHAIAQPAESQATLGRERIVGVAVNGLISGSVDVKITTDQGQVYYYTGNGQGIPSGALLGEFPLPGTYFDIEITPRNVSPSFLRFGGAPFLQFATPESYTSRCTWSEEDLGGPGGTHMTIFFGSLY